MAFPTPQTAAIGGRVPCVGTRAGFDRMLRRLAGWVWALSAGWVVYVLPLTATETFLLQERGFYIHTPERSRATVHVKGVPPHSL